MARIDSDSDKKFTFLDLKNPDDSRSMAIR